MVKSGSYLVALLILFSIPQEGSFLRVANNLFHLHLKSPFSYSDSIPDSIPWKMHLIDPHPPSGADGVKMADVNGDGFPDLVTGFEEGGISRIYINPGFAKSKEYWKFVELPTPDVEDAVLVDLDNDGNVDLVTASEGNTNQIRFHWAPNWGDVEHSNSGKWKTHIVPATTDLSAWMFVVPIDMDGKNGVDLIVGSKRKKGETGNDKAVVGWLQSPENPRDIGEWKFHVLTTAGWIMSMEIRDMDGDGHSDIVISDRKNSSRTGIRWLKNPGKGSSELYEPWSSHFVADNLEEPMFHSSADLDGSGEMEIIVPDLYKGLAILTQKDDPMKHWDKHLIPYPNWAGNRGKAVVAGDVNLDGKIDLVLSFEEEGKVSSIPYEIYKTTGRYSVIWGSFERHPISGSWSFNKVSGLKGRKFDLVNLIDLDGDGDLDVITTDENEEETGLGVVWYENPIRSNE